MNPSVVQPYAISPSLSLETGTYADPALFSPQAMSHHSTSPTASMGPPHQMYPTSSYYQGYQQGHPGMPMGNPGYPSPSSNDSASVSSPPQDIYMNNGASSSSSNVNGKRPSTSDGNTAGGRKKARKDDAETDASTPKTPVDGSTDAPSKPKTTRGSRACTTCRRLKMKCVGAEQGPPCKRCSSGGHECIFEESNRGKRSTKKHEILTRSLRKMERTLDTVLRSIGNPSVASAMMSRSPSPVVQESPHDPDANGTANLLGSRDPTPPIARPTSSRIHSSHSHRHPGQSLHSPILNGRPASPKLHSLPDNALNPLGLLAEASLANRRSSTESMNAAGFVARNAAIPSPGVDPSGSTRLGVASANYFKPGPMTILPLRRLYIERQIQPEMLTFTSKEQVMRLFNIFFDNINAHVPLLEREFHTPALVCSRSPFLLTTICAIAAKFLPAEENVITLQPSTTNSPTNGHSSNPPSANLHQRLIDLAKKLAYSVPAAGYKSVEIVQAYLLLAQWGCGAVERYEQDRTWGLLGMGIRMATDLNLHRKSLSSLSRPRSILPGTELGGSPNGNGTVDQKTVEERQRVREIHNRERTWVVCFCLDRSFSAQLGKPYAIREDEIIRDVNYWATSPVANRHDLGLAAYVELQRIVSRFLDFLYSAMGTDSASASGLLGQCDHMLVIRAFETQLATWHDAWHVASLSGPSSDYYRPMSQFYFHYALLVLNSFGLQDSLTRTPVNIPHFFSRVYHSAMRCAEVVKDELGPGGYLKYCSDSHFVQISYTVLSLMKLARPEFQSFLDSEQRILAMVTDVANLLESCAVNPHHTPALYSTFLKALVTAKFEEQIPQPVAPQPQQAMDTNGMLNTNGGPGPILSMNDTTTNFLDQYQFHGEMGNSSHDMSTFPPTMLSPPSATAPDFASASLGAGAGNGSGGLGNPSSNDSLNILSSGFWDSMLVPGYSTMDGFSGGFVFGAGGSGLITPKLGGTPVHSGRTSPIGGVPSGAGGSGL
ncbi:fungal-specific transcription factor domain-containing protein [Flagelloscypha sp. PMI_526]|nr:fungal-specific transcription factor domain-containing protein [Flagelloscypha sp. PMI_526]